MRSRLFHPIVFTLVVLAFLVPTSPAFPDGFRISGTVVDSQTLQPLDHVEVIMSLPTNVNDSRHFVTSSDGHFVFTNLPAGKYRLTAERPGYASQAFHEHEEFSTYIVTGPNQPSENLTFPLLRSAVITGVITDEWGDPVRNARIFLFSFGLSFGSAKAHMVGNADTDDRGRYRLPNLDPGVYAVMVSAYPWYRAQLRDRGGEASSRALSNPALDVVYPFTYYPNSSTLAGAAKLTLSPGASQSADIAIHPVPSIHLLVKTSIPQVEEPEDGNASPEIARPLTSVNVVRSIGEEFSDTETFPFDQHEISPGLVEISGLQPGEVRILSDPQSASNRAVSARSLDLSSSMEVDLTLHGSLVDVSGVAHIEGKQEDAQAKPSNSPRLVPADPMDGEAHIGQLTFRSTTTGDSYMAPFSGEDGLSLGPLAIPAGSYEVAFDHSPELELTKLEAEGATVSHLTVDIPAGHPVKLTIHLAANDSSISGVALKKGKPLAGAMIVLVPQDPNKNASEFHRDQTDSDGSFTLSDLYPGQYTLLAIENGWDLEWASPSVLFRYLPNGLPVTVTPNSTATLNPTVQ
jgi:hypothetical protein